MSAVRCVRTYWRAAKNSAIFSVLNDIFPGQEIIAFGEVIPVQSGYNYGLNPSKPEILVFRIIVNGKEIPFEELQKLSNEIKYVPLVKQDLFNGERILKIGKKLKHSILEDARLPSHGNPCAVRDENQIAEGIVVSPQFPRRASDGTPLYLKVISDKYAKVEDEEAIS